MWYIFKCLTVFATYLMKCWFFRLQVVSASVDLLTCRFIDQAGRRHVIHATITETYPTDPPVWFSDSEDPKVSSFTSYNCCWEGNLNRMGKRNEKDFYIHSFDIGYDSEIYRNFYLISSLKASPILLIWFKLKYL